MPQVRAPKRSLIGIVLAIVGTLGLAGSGILWNFQGKEYGLTGTITSILALAFGFLFLWPLQTMVIKTQSSNDDAEGIENHTHNNDVSEEQTSKIETIENEIIASETTAESIARELAESLETMPKIELRNFSNNHLLPGKTINTKIRQPGPSLQKYRTMVKDIL